MDKGIARRCLVLLAMVLALAGFSTLVVGLARADNVAQTLASSRDLEPVIVSGKSVSALNGFSVDQLFVYAYRDDMWRQIPSQVDEYVTASGYTVAEDGILDRDDEIVFMARDIGVRAPLSKSVSRVLPITGGWYTISVTDPISPTMRGWAYLVHSRELTRSVSTDYVNFDPGFHRIEAAGYHLGFSTTHPGVDYLTLNGGGREILDRTKVRIDCRIPVICPLTEDNLDPLPDGLIKDGPVRVILRQGRVLAYGRMLRWTSTFDMPRFARGVRLSTDFNAEAIGSTYYNNAVPDGVVVDGISDTVPTVPLSPWWQLSTDTGTVVHVADTAAIGGIQSNYYADSAAWDPSDTGDRRRYGDTGINVDDPRSTFTHTVGIYVLPPRAANAGQNYATSFARPLSVSLVLHGDPRPEKIYLPLFVGKAATQDHE